MHWLLIALVAIVSDATERSQVLHSVFLSYLTGACPKIPEADEVHTWVEADELQALTHARGWFAPGPIARVHGTFTHLGAQETLYTVEVGECVENGGRSYVDVVFDSSSSAVPSRATRRALVTTSQWTLRGQPAVRSRPGDVDEVSFEPGVWLRLSSPTTWSRSP